MYHDKVATCAFELLDPPCLGGYTCNAVASIDMI